MVAIMAVLVTSPSRRETWCVYRNRSDRGHGRARDSSREDTAGFMMVRCHEIHPAILAMMTGKMPDYPMLYLEHLSQRDVEVLAGLTGAAPGDLRAELRRHPGGLDDLLGREDLFESVFRPDPEDGEIVVGITPFFVFGVLVNRATRDLAQAAFVPEWVGSGQRLPVFDVETLRQFICDDFRRYFVIEFLASFTRVASGVIWVRTPRGYRRRRYNELDPVGLTELVEAMPPSQRAAGYRRLGDVALFLAGVFPDHTYRSSLGEMARSRLARSAGISDVGSLDAEHDVRFFEVVGPGWYVRAVDSASQAVGVGPEYLRDVASRFTDARRLLNFLADRYLHRYDTGLMNPAV